MVSLDFVYGFFQPALVIRWFYIFWGRSSVHSARILFHGWVEHKFLRGSKSQISLPSSLCQRTWQDVISALFCLLRSLFSSSSHAPDHMREQAGSMGLMLGLVLLSCYIAHFLVLCVQYVELRARHCTEVETAQFPVSCCGSGRWKQLLPCWSFAW